MAQCISSAAGIDFNGQGSSNIAYVNKVLVTKMYDYLNIFPV